MAIFRTGTNDWNSLTIPFEDALTWYDPLDDAAGTITHTTQTQDFGYPQWVWPEVAVGSVSVGSGGISVQYETSLDNSTFTTVAADQSFYARYVRVTIVADADQLLSVNAIFNNDIETRTYQNLDTTTLGGNVGGRTLDLSDDFSAIFGIIINNGAGDDDVLGVDVVDTDPANITFVIRDLDTYGKIAVDGVVNITITGYPALDFDSDTGTVERRFG